MADSLTQEERDLIEGFLRGDPAAVGCIDGWIDAVLRDRFRSLEGHWDDLKQDIRIRVLRNLRDERFGARSSLRTYVHRIATYVSIDHSRQAWRRHEIPVETAGTGWEPRESRVDPEAWIARDVLQRLTRDLAEGDRILLWLVCGRHLSYTEIAREMGTTEGAVKVRVHRLKERLVKQYREMEH